MKSVNLRDTSCNLFAIWVIASAGCGKTVITEYGQRSGWTAGSVNGTTVLGDLFTSAGHQVRSWRYLSPSLEEADVIVWAPDRFELPSTEVQDWFDKWLRKRNSARQLIYIGRGYDAAITYWQTIQSEGSPKQKAEVARRLREARTQFNADLKTSPAEESWGNWFSWRGQSPPVKISKLSGRWAKNVDVSKTQIERTAQLVPAVPSDQTLLLGDGKPLVSQFAVQRRSRSRVTVVDNGSFLLNIPLVNHEHRKLAGCLVEDIGSTPKKIVFLETGQQESRILDEDPGNQTPTGLEMFAIWPLSGVLLHLAMLGGLIALSSWPIFGTPRHLPQPSLTDFGRHLHALGALLSQSADPEFAKQTLDTYRQNTSRE